MEDADTASPNSTYARLLCRAIEQRLLVELTYEGDSAPRSFAPHALYWSGEGQISVTGIQHDNLGKRSPPHQPRNFALEKIESLATTRAHFSPGPPIDPSAPKYRFGIICMIR